MTDYNVPIEFAKLIPGNPKNARGWLWRCGCVKCQHLEQTKRIVHGPFTTLRAAKKSAEETIALLAAEPHGAA